MTGYDIAKNLFREYVTARRNFRDTEFAAGKFGTVYQEYVTAEAAWLNSVSQRNLTQADRARLAQEVYTELDGVKPIDLL